MAETKMVGFVFVEGFADWEYGFYRHRHANGSA